MLNYRNIILYVFVKLRCNIIGTLDMLNFITNLLIKYNFINTLLYFKINLLISILLKIKFVNAHQTY